MGPVNSEAPQTGVHSGRACPKESEMLRGRHAIPRQAPQEAWFQAERARERIKRFRQTEKGLDDECSLFYGAVFVASGTGVKVYSGLR